MLTASSSSSTVWWIRPRRSPYSPNQTNHTSCHRFLLICLFEMILSRRVPIWRHNNSYGRARPYHSLAHPRCSHLLAKSDRPRGDAEPDQRAKDQRLFFCGERHAESSGAVGLAPAVHSRLPPKGVIDDWVYFASARRAGALYMLLPPIHRVQLEASCDILWHVLSNSFVLWHLV